MNPAGGTIDLSDATASAVLPIHPDDLPALADATARSGLRLARIELAGCDDKPCLLRRIASALAFPAGFGENWDALSDNLRDLGWLSAAGHVLLFERADHLRDRSEDDYDVLLDVLDDAAATWARRDQPFFAFLELAERDGERTGEAVGAAGDDGPEDASAPPDIVFVLDGEHVELNQLLKRIGLAESGGAGKALVARGAVCVDGARELRKTCKIRAGQRVTVDGIRIDVTREE